MKRILAGLALAAVAVAFAFWAWSPVTNQALVPGTQIIAGEKVLTVAEADAIEAWRRSSYIGVGLSTERINLVGTGILVKEVQEASTAEDAGLKVGDIITSVDGVTLVNWKFDAVTARIQGPVDSKVVLGILRDGKALEVAVTRDLDERIGVELQLHEPKAAYQLDYVYDKAPAALAGLLKGDVLVSIDGVSTSAATAEDVSRRLKVGRPGSTVKVEVLRGLAMQQFTITRDFVENWSMSLELSGQMTSGRGWYHYRIMNLDYVDLAKWTDNFMESINQQKGALIDLRGTSGNDPDIAAALAARFIDDGVVLRYESEKDGQRVEVVYEMKGGKLVKTGFDGGLPAGEMPLPEKLPRFTGTLVVLVDDETAGTAEALARLLQESGRATVTGFTTAGKPVLQTVEKKLVGGQEQTVVSSTRKLLARDGGALASVTPDTRVWSRDSIVKKGLSQLPGEEDSYYYSEELPWIMGAGMVGIFLFVVLVVTLVGKWRGKGKEDEPTQEEPADEPVEEEAAPEPAAVKAPEKPGSRWAGLALAASMLFVLAMVFGGANWFTKRMNAAPEGTTAEIVVQLYVDGTEASNRQTAVFDQLKGEYQGDIRFEKIDVVADPDRVKALNWDNPHFPVVIVRHVFKDATGKEIGYSSNGRGYPAPKRDLVRSIKWQIEGDRRDGYPKVKVERIVPIKP